MIFRGGKEAIHSSRAIVELLSEAADEVGLPADAVQLVSTTDRAAVGQFLRCRNTSMWPFPAAAKGSFAAWRPRQPMPVIKHFAGNCHVYVDAAADLEMAQSILRQQQVPAAGRVQRGRVAAGARRRGGRIAAR